MHPLALDRTNATTPPFQPPRPFLPYDTTCPQAPPLATSKPKPSHIGSVCTGVQPTPPCSRSRERDHPTLSNTSSLPPLGPDTPMCTAVCYLRVKTEHTGSVCTGVQPTSSRSRSDEHDHPTLSTTSPLPLLGSHMPTRTAASHLRVKTEHIGSVCTGVQPARDRVNAATPPF